MNTVASASFYFYDLETSGREPRWHRVLQFAGVAADAEFNALHEPTVLHAKLPIDVLPDPEAMLVTGFTVMQLASGCAEWELATRIQKEVMSAPCLAGFNSIRFDDEFLRYTFYRALLDPYQHEQPPGSRWDVLDLARAAFALRPDGVNWPLEDGLPVFRLTALTAANGIMHAHAHDAGSDTMATLQLARLIHQRQPRLVAHSLSLRDRRVVEKLIWQKGPAEPLVHVSGHLPKANGHLALIAPIAQHPRNKRSVMVFDLAEDPAVLEDLSADEIRRRVFTPAKDLDVPRLPIKELRTNRCPFVAPLAVLRPNDRQRWRLDVDQAGARLRWLSEHKAVAAKVVQAFSHDGRWPSNDVEARLYDGFFSDRDRGVVRRWLMDGPEAPLSVADERLSELAFRYRAKRFPANLSEDELQRWDGHVRRRLTGLIDPALGLAAFLDTVDQQLLGQRTDAERRLLIDWQRYALDLEARVNDPIAPLTPC